MYGAAKFCTILYLFLIFTSVFSVSCHDGISYVSNNPSDQKNLPISSISSSSYVTPELAHLLYQQQNLVSQQKLLRVTRQAVLPQQQMYCAMQQEKQCEAARICKFTVGDYVKTSQRLYVQKQVAQKEGNKLLQERIERRCKALPYGSIGAEDLLLSEFYSVNQDLLQLKRHYGELEYFPEVDRIVTSCFDAARATEDMMIAFENADVAHDVVYVAEKISKILRNAQKGLCAIARGAVVGVRESLTVEHWQAVMKSLQHLPKLVGKAAAKLGEAATLLQADGGMQSEQIIESYNQVAVTNQQQLQLYSKALQDMPWEKIVESGVAVGATLLTDIIITEGAVLATQSSGRQLFAQMSRVFQREGATEAYCAEVAGLAKVVVEEGAAASTEALATVGTDVEVEGLTEVPVGKLVSDEVLARKALTIEVVQEVECTLVKRIRGNRDVFEGNKIKEKHIISEAHKRGGILELGYSEPELIELFKKVVRRLDREDWLRIGDNRVYTFINKFPIEIRVHFDKDGYILSMNGFVGHSERKFKNHISRSLESLL